MSSPESEQYAFATEAEINSFGKHLYKSKRILALCGAGLSAPSGIPTFRGPGALWRNHKAASISSVDAFEANPGLVWQYFVDRRHLALQAEPNEGHYALAKLAKKRKGFVCLTQNIDGLAERAKHPKERLYSLHGSLLDIKCSNTACDYVDKWHMTDPLCSALVSDVDVSSFSSKPKATPDALATKLSSVTLKEDQKPNPLQEILDSLAPIITPEMREEVIPTSQLPHCPKCSALLRPGVVWFGESLSQAIFDEINAWIDAEKKLDLMMVIGTMAEVYPAARFVQTAKEKGARIAVVNLDGDHLGGNQLRKQDWLFEGDSAEILPVLFEGTLEN